MNFICLAIVNLWAWAGLEHDPKVTGPRLWVQYSIWINVVQLFVQKYRRKTVCHKKFLASQFHDIKKMEIFCRTLGVLYTLVFSCKVLALNGATRWRQPHLSLITAWLFPFYMNDLCQNIVTRGITAVKWAQTLVSLMLTASHLSWWLWCCLHMAEGCAVIRVTGHNCWWVNSRQNLFEYKTKEKGISRHSSDYLQQLGWIVSLPLKLWEKRCKSW